MLEAGEAKKAINYLNESLEIEPDNDAAWYEKSRALESLGETEEAKDCLEKAAALNPNNNYKQKEEGIVEAQEH